MQKEAVLLTKNLGVATLSLNRPQVRNAFDSQTILSLTQHLHRLQRDASVKILVLKGEGEHFSAGADINWMQKSIQYTKTENHQDALNLSQLLYSLYHFNKPSIVLLQGSVFGGALGLVACCDIAIADPNTRFCFSEVKLGLVPAVVSPYVIRAIGERMARRYMLTAETFTAKEAESLSLIHEQIELKDQPQRLHYFTEKLLQNAPLALQATKQLLHGLNETKNFASVMEYTAELIAEVRTTPEAQEGLKAFLEKRAPRWQLEQQTA